MKILIFSDIHGIKNNLDYLKEVYEKEKCDRVIVLGDLYYIGPRNTMIPGYDIQAVKNFLESFGEKLISLRGNCDSQVDLDVSSFVIVPELEYLSLDGLDLYFTHGDLYNRRNHEKIPSGSVLIYGHEHMPYMVNEDNRWFINPGSISLPKGDTYPSYLIYENRTFTIYDVKGQVLFKQSLSFGD